MYVRFNAYNITALEEDSESSSLFLWLTEHLSVTVEIIWLLPMALCIQALQW